jgi:hypothetical protein
MSVSAQTIESYVGTDQAHWRGLQPTQVFRDSSTSETRQEPIYDRLWLLFRSAKDEVFENGIESSFSKSLAKLIHENWSETLEKFALIIEQPEVNDETGSEALQVLGRIDHASSFVRRLWLVRHYLFSESPDLREASSLALASLDDPDAIADLKAAIDREPINGLREDMIQVLRQLENTFVCANPPRD